LEGRRRRDGLLGHRILVAGRSDSEALLQQLDERGADLPLQRDDVLEPLVLEAVALELIEECERSRLALDGTLAADEGQDRQLALLGAPILGVRDRDRPSARAVLPA